jgi:hypothetical protein
MKTITHKGKVYQIGGMYEFSDSGSSWHIEMLYNICDQDFFETYCEHINDSSSWKKCRSVSGELGTIEDAPLELEDGEWYVFNVEFNPFAFVGYYSEKRNSFMNGDNKVCGKSEANNIGKMVREDS